MAAEIVAKYSDDRQKMASNVDKMEGPVVTRNVG
jgi:hypothetical protein